MKVEEYLEQLKELCRKAKPMGTMWVDKELQENYRSILDKADSVPKLIKIIEKQREALRLYAAGKHAMECDDNDFMSLEPGLTEVMPWEKS